MKETILEKNIKRPYSLHDMVINNIEIVGNDVKLFFEHGFTKTKDPYNQVDGSIKIKNVDFDFADIYFLSENGSYGNYNGKKITVKNFIKEYKNYSLEVVNELFGYNMVEYSGFLTIPGEENLIEFSLGFYYTGNLIYYTKEWL